MAVPGAVMRRKEQQEAELRAQGFDPNGAPLAMQTGDESAPTAPAAPAPAAPVAQTPDEVTRLQNELSTQNGRLSAAAREAEDAKRQLEIVNANRGFLESKLSELTEQVTALQRQNEELAAQRVTSNVDQVVSALDSTGPTEAQLKEFGDDSVDFIQRVTKRELAGVIKPLIERLAAMEKVLGRVKEIDGKLPQLESAAQVAHINDARARELEFLRKEILPHYPDFETVRGTPEWRAYLMKDVPGRGYKIGQLLKTYRESSDAVGIRTLIGTFYDTKTSKPSLESLSVPAKTGADAPEKPATPKMLASEYKQKLRDFTSKRLSREEWDAYRARWEAAISSGNVEMDIELR